MSNTEISAVSRYKYTSLIQRDADLFWGLWNSEPINMLDVEYVTYQIRDYDIGRLDLVSYRQYGTVDFWWIIAHVNNFVDVIVDMRVGAFIKLPSRTAIDSFVQRMPQ